MSSSVAQCIGIRNSDSQRSVAHSTRPRDDVLVDNFQEDGLCNRRKHHNCWNHAIALIDQISDRISALSACVQFRRGRNSKAIQDQHSALILLCGGAGGGRIKSFFSEQISLFVLLLIPHFREKGS